jgi:hypothetical protein
MPVIVSETRERFLLAIASQIPPERIVEIHFFQPIKQGGVESGVAVIAAVLNSRAPESDETMAQSGPTPRYTVFTARYRLTLKGIDRGKWEASVVEEADAPLITVETVVQGVQRRSGDAEDPERIDGADVRGVLGAVAKAQQ